MIISIFGGTVLRPGMEDAEAQAMDRLVPIYSSMPGFISYRYYTGEDGEEISIARFTTRDAVREWVRQPDHVEVQRMAGDLYTDMWVQTAETYREARLVDGRPLDTDLTALLREG
jgi:heme-degrading monooxygenase HmoA